MKPELNDNFDKWNTLDWFPCVKEVITYRMKNTDFMSCEHEAQIFDDLIIYNLLAAHVFCMFICLYREIYESNVRLTG